jgi:hypothetical protein
MPVLVLHRKLADKNLNMCCSWLVAKALTASSTGVGAMLLADVCRGV